MSSAYTKQKLKQSREALAKKDWVAASEAASDVLEHESDNYNANVFLGLALLNQGKYAESEAAYRKATADQPSQLLAWQGLQKFYETQKKWDQLRDILHTLLDLYNDAGESTKCAETYQRLLALEREEGGKKSVLETLTLLLPDSKYYGVLSQLDVPDQTQPEKTTTFETQMAIHVKSLDVLLEMVDLAERWEAEFIQKESDKRRMRLDGANKGKEALTNEVRLEVYSQSRLPGLYDQILSHPKAEDELRVETEAKLLRHRVALLLAFPPKQLLPRGSAPTGTAAVDANEQAKRDQADEERQRQKEALRDEIVKLASGMVIIGLADQLAWEIELEWRPLASLAHLNLEQMRKFVSLFPRSGRSMAFRPFLLLIQDAQYLEELKEAEKHADTEVVIPQTHDELLNLAIDGLEECPNSILTHRIASAFYLIDRDFQSASEVANSAISLLGRIEAESAVDLEATRLGISSTLLTALTHLHPPQHHARASRLADSVLRDNEIHIDALLAKAYIEQYAHRWQSAKQLFDKVRAIVGDSSQTDTSSHRYRVERTLSLTKAPDQEGWIESAWCDVHLGALDGARSEMEAILERIDPIAFQGADSELRSKVWWRLGQCLWLKGGEFQSDPSHAFTAFITALKRNPAFAPAYTSLGLYYEDVLDPPDLNRASKCFQKAFELDARENVAARRLAEGFAEEREWDLVEVVARRTIEGEGGLEALSGAKAAAVQAARRHLSQNAWAWKAIGSVEIANKRFEEAILALQIALRADSYDVVCWQRLGEAYVLAGRHVAALKCFAKCLELIGGGTADDNASVNEDDDGWQVRYSIGDVHVQLGNFATAIEVFNDILVEHPDQVGVRIALANAQLLSSRQELASGYVVRAEGSAVQAIRESGRVLLQHDKHLRSAWKSVADAVFHLSKLGVMSDMPALLGRGDDKSDLVALLELAHELGTDEKLPSINAVTRSKLVLLGSSREGFEAAQAPFGCLQASVYLYKLRVVLNASDDKVAGSAWGDLATALYRYSRAVVLPSSHALLSVTSANGDNDIEKVATEIAASARLQAIGSLKEALRHEPGNETYWLLLGNLTFETSVKLAQHSFVRAIEAAPKSPVGWTNLGLLYLRHGDVELANEAFIKGQTADPDYGPAWVGQALVAKHYGDLRAGRVLFEHAVSLTEADLLEADYGLAATVLGPASAGLNETSMFGSSFAMSSYLSRSPMDVDALHLSALISERLGQSQLAIDRIARATELLEQRYESSESPLVANMYAVAQANLARIKLADRDFQGAREGFESALGLLDTDADGAGEDQPESPDQEEEDGSLSKAALINTRIGCLVGLSICAHFQPDASNESENSTSRIREAIALASKYPDTIVSLRTKLDLVLQHAKLLFSSAGDGNADVAEEFKSMLLDNFQHDASHVPSLVGLGVLAMVHKDSELWEALAPELESALSTPGTVQHALSIVRVLTVGKENAQDKLQIIHSAIQTLLQVQSQPSQASQLAKTALFNLHLLYLSHAVAVFSTSSTSTGTDTSTEELNPELRSQIQAYISLTQDLFSSYAALDPIIEHQRTQLYALLADLKQALGQDAPQSINLDVDTLRSLQLLDAPWLVASAPAPDATA
ncbi:hypothetical protein BCV70DRAFT_2683 [Testicularia cyperi]|uniref:TPR-like protein n=1 Tax=Testicularia cyperi TaxID=1882483 RepID=A0A317XWS4_9BASI|nr:hypothetical protein BCV70DRAFT_2683 [Testicularia cyperi]